MLIYADRRWVASFAPGEKYELQSIGDVSGVRYRQDVKGLAHYDRCVLFSPRILDNETTSLLKHGLRSEI